ncbi:TetR/AcrR family transcriptional regulator, partial [Streptomyces scabiei]|uniref:TetR/AcrR family transcriptional regulator n=1 Tax=Streptomyces scabiei TaxID=1930 RepID=UPI000A38FFC3
MADISAAAGVARGSGNWYYSSKDDVFAAVMDRTLSRRIQALDRELHDRDPLTALTRLLADMRTFRRLHRASHERLDHSSAVRKAHERFLHWMRSMVYEVLGRHPPPMDREMFADPGVAVFEGANVPRSPQRPAHELIRFLLEGVVAGELLGWVPRGAGRRAHTRCDQFEIRQSYGLMASRKCSELKPIKRAPRRNLDMGSTGRNELPSSVGPASTGAPT